jgi:hypothetical protein
MLIASRQERSPRDPHAKPLATDMLIAVACLMPLPLRACARGAAPAAAAPCQARKAKSFVTNHRDVVRMPSLSHARCRHARVASACAPMCKPPR